MNRIKRYGRWMAVWLLLLVFFSGCSGAKADASVPNGAEADANGVEPAGQDAGVDDGDASAPGKGSAALSGAENDSAAEAPDGTLTVTFLDVGQGNAVLVEHDGLYMLIDGGDREYSSFVVSYLKNQGVEELAYVVSSHYDADHLNGVVGVLNAFPCDTVLAADYTTDSRVYESFCSVVEEKDISLVYPAMGDTYSFGDAEFTVTCPDNYDYADDNDNSVGIRLVYGENSFLICGDADSGMEQMMMGSGLELDSDVYLASHHGSAGSSSLEFLQAVSPAAVVISAGAGNSYGHPTGRVLEDVKSIGADLYRTDRQGTIVVTSDGSTLSWNVEPCTDYRSGEELAADAEAQAGEAAGTAAEQTYIMNRNTKKFHLPSCSSAADISPDNRAEFTGLRQDLIDAGYEPCKRCNP